MSPDQKGPGTKKQERSLIRTLGLVVFVGFVVGIAGVGLYTSRSLGVKSTGAVASESKIAIDGSRVYSSSCTSCHGYAVETLKNIAEVEQLISKERRPGEMHGFGDALSKEQIKAVAEYVIANQGPSPAAEAGRLYNVMCATCHGQKGSLLSRYDLSSKVFWQSANDRNIVKSVIEGKGGMPPLGAGKGGTLSDSQAGSIIAYLRTKAVEGTKTAATPGPSSSSTTARPKAASPSLNSEHDENWLREHSRFVMESGAGRCYKCHDNKFCVECHVRR